MGTIYLAQVEKVSGRTGSRGGVEQVQVKVFNAETSGGQQLTRNVKGPVREGDILSLYETDRDARRLR